VRPTRSVGITVDIDQAHILIVLFEELWQRLIKPAFVQGHVRRHFRHHAFGRVAAFRLMMPDIGQPLETVKAMNGLLREVGQHADRIAEPDAELHHNPALDT